MVKQTKQYICLSSTHASDELIAVRRAKEDVAVISFL